MEKICPVCGKPIEHIGSNRQKYCSLQCRRKANRNVESIKKHTKTIYERAEIYDHFRNRCAICGWEITQEKDGNGRHNWSHGCDIHHIIPATEGGEDNAENLILLCPNCHKLADYGIITRDALKMYLRKFDQNNELFFKYFEKLSTPEKRKALDFMKHQDEAQG